MAVKKQNFDIKKAQENAQKKKDRRNKIYAYILLAFFIFWTICSGLSIYNMITQHFSADNGRIVASADVVHENDRYPSENLFNIPYFYEVQNGIVVELKNNVLSINGTSTSDITLVCPLSTVFRAGTYTVNASINMPFYGYLCRSSNLYYNRITILSRYISNGVSTFSLEDTYDTFMLYVGSGQTVHQDVSIMINYGDVAYPFIPNLEQIYNAGFNAGNAGILGGLVVDYMYDPANYVDGYSYALGTWVPSVFVRGGIDLTSLANQVISEVGGAIGLGEHGSKFDFVFSQPIARNNFGVSFGQNDYTGSASISTVYNRSYVTWSFSSDLIDTREIIIDIVPDNGVLSLDLSSVPDGGYISSLHLIDFDPRSFYRVMYDEHFDYNMVYQEGFENGYNEGIQNGSVTADKQYQNGYNAGYDIGYGLGEQAGILSANDYSFFSLIAACIDAPVQAFMGLFNFEILGLNMSNFFLGLLTAGLVLCVLKYVLGGS